MDRGVMFCIFLIITAYTPKTLFSTSICEFHKFIVSSSSSGSAKSVTSSIWSDVSSLNNILNSKNDLGSSSSFQWNLMKYSDLVFVISASLLSVFPHLKVYVFPFFVTLSANHLSSPAGVLIAFHIIIPDVGFKGYSIFSFLFMSIDYVFRQL